jgi:hypothetical protein
MDEGAIIYNDATAGAANLLEFNKTAPGSGNILDFDFSAAFTGNVLNLDMGSAVAANGLVIDSEAGARTGSDILISDDSTGNHSVINIDKSGAGATVGLDYQESYTGSSASFAIKITLDANDGLDTTAMQVVRNAGIRTVPVIDINEASTGSADIIDIDVSGVYTGDVIDITTSAAATGNAIFINLDSAVAMTALHVEGSGVRTQPFVEFNTDCTGAVSYVEFTISGATWSGHVIEVSMDAATTGDVLNVDMNAALAGRFLFLDAGAGTRTANLVEVTNDGDGNVDVIEITDSNTGSGHLFDINVSGIGSGNVIDITYSAADTGDALKVVMADNLAGGALVITGAGTRTDSLVDIVTAEDGAVDGIVSITTSAVFTGYVMTLTSGAASTTGALLHLNLDAGVAYKALVIDHAGARTSADILVTFDGTAGAAAGGTLLDVNVTMSGAGANPLIDIDVDAIYTGNILDITFGTSAATGDAIAVAMGTNVAGSAISITGAGIRTDNLIKIVDSSTGNANLIDINVTGIYTGNILDITYSVSAATGDAISVAMATAVAASAIVLTGTGARTDDLIKIDDDSTGNSQIFDINISGAYTGNVLDIAFSVAAATGDAISIVMGTAVAGSAIVLTGTGVRTDDLIKIDDDSTGNSHIFDINLSGIYTGNVLDITFSVAAATSDAISLAMGTDVAGRAIAVTSAATGTADEGSILDVEHTGNLAAGADLVTIHSTGSPSATSNLLSIEQDTGAGGAGAYGLYINCTGANVEAIHVDAGTVLFDETLTVAGAVTCQSTLGVTGTLTTNGATINAGIADFPAGTPAALSLTETVQTVGADAGGDTYTLADGTAGQIVYIICHDATGTATITPATTNGAWTSVTFNALNDSVVLMYTSLGWTIIGGNSYAIV